MKQQLLIKSIFLLFSLHFSTFPIRLQQSSRRMFEEILSMNCNLSLHEAYTKNEIMWKLVVVSGTGLCVCLLDCVRVRVRCACVWVRVLFLRYKLMCFCQLQNVIVRCEAWNRLTSKEKCARRCSCHRCQKMPEPFRFTFKVDGIRNNSNNWQ